MYSTRLLSSLAAFAAGVAADWPQDVSVDSFVATEHGIALQGALANIGPNGSQVPGAGAGFVVASPSKVNPNYFYTWSRDSALTLKTLVDEFLFGSKALQTYIEDYIHAQAVLQTVTNPSGSLLGSGLGLGEPKFNVDGTRFNGNWGRPQRDGPALRAIAIIEYSNWLISQGQSDKVKNVIWPIIQNDLSYVGQYWNSTGFDLWEETSGSSFFTTQNQYRSLVEGSTLASVLGVPCTGCSEAPNVLCFLQSYWNGEYMVANTNLQTTSRSGIDANTVLGPISVFDVDAACDSPSLQPCHSRVLANFKVFVDTFRDPSLYPINAGLPATSGVAVGRYPEDVYYNGNPWYLITLGAAEFLYDAAAQWSRQGFVTVDPTSLGFFNDLYPNVTVGTYKRCKKSDPFRKIVDAARTYADSFVAIVQTYTPSNGTLSEQFLKTAPGTPLSANALTWSFASFVTMAQRRAGQFPPSWVPTNTTVPVPGSCVASSTPGVYAPATAAGAPNVTQGCTSNVMFVVNATTYYGENVYLTGNTTDLGSWNLDNAQPMLASNYTGERPEWFVTVAMTAGEPVTYGYVRQENCGQPWIWEQLAQNRTLVVPACGNSTAVRLQTDDAWTGPTGQSGNC
ncbi:1, 4-alpha-D-glucan glucohydrolase [Diplogelasinospora grovesii]|uniref:Glucoamylase n=1 Tax=Diplogelasinospora grovesii TaxID=303347 RepID=A0AAN6NGW5_9PEZI|nr:1, 4-alpha-D-glucan glucohydrolase [Diplogelasinospora grovesii]